MVEQGLSNQSGGNSNDFKRNTAYKIRIGEILQGKPNTDSSTGRFSFLELGNKNIVRVNIVGNIIDKYESQGDKQYIFYTVDDGSGQIPLKVFGDDVNKFKDMSQGQTIVCIGKMRTFNDQLFILPEIMKEKDAKYLLVRKKEIEKEKSENTSKPESSEQKAIKDQILDLIKKAEDSGGIESDQIIMNPSFSNASPDIINQEIKKMLEEGIIFEPRPGKLRYLG